MDSHHRTHGCGRTFGSLSRGTLGLLGAAFFLAVAPARAGWNKTDAGPHNYLDTANWDGGVIDNVFPSSTILTAAQTATFNTDHTLTSGLDFGYGGNFGITVRADGTGARTLTLGGDVNLNTASGTSANVTIGSTTGNQNLHIDLGGVARTFDIASGRTLTLYNILSNGGLVKNSAGELRLISTANTFSGDIHVNAGVLAIGSDSGVTDGCLGDVGNTVYLTGSSLRIGTSNTRSVLLDPRRTISISGNVSIIGPSGYGSAQYGNIPGDIVGSGSMTIQCGDMILSGNNTGVGQLTLNGMLRISSEANLGGDPNSAIYGTQFSDKGFSIMGTSLSNLSGHTFPWVTNQGIRWDIQDPANTFTWDKNFNIGMNAATAPGMFFKYGPGTLVVTTSQTYNNVQVVAPDTVLGGGILKVDYTAGGSLPSSGDGNQLGFVGGTLYLLGQTDTAVAQSFANVKLMPGGGTLTVDNNAGATTTTANLGDFVTMAAPAAGSTLNLRTINPGSGSANVASMQLNDGSGIVGGTAAGRIVYNGADWPSSGSTSTGGVAYDAGTDRVTGTQADGTAVAFTATAPGGINANVVYYVVQSSGTDFKLSLTLGGAAINLTTTSSGTLTTLGPLSAYSGYTVGLPASGAASSINYSQADNASVTASETVNTLKLTTTTTGQSLAITAGQTLALNTGGMLFTGADDYSISGGTLSAGTTRISTTSGQDLIIQHYGAGTLTIGSMITNSVSPADRIGTTTSTTKIVTDLSSTADLYAGMPVKVAGGATTTINSVNSASQITLNANAGVTGTPLLTFTSVNALTIAGTGTVKLTSANTYTGQTFVNGATLEISDNNQLNNSANTQLNLYGAALNATETISTGRAVVLGGEGGTFDVADTKTLTLSGTVSGGRLTLENSDGGNGILGLSGGNGFSGGIAINGGILKLGHNNAFGAWGFNTLSFGPAAVTKTLQINGARTIAVAGLTSAATDAVVENGAAGAAQLNVYNGADNTFSGVMQDGAEGTLAFAKAGCGTLTLTGASTYTGATTVQGGTLAVNGSLAAGSAVTVQKGALGGVGTVAGPVTVEAGGALAPGNGVGTLATGALTLTAGAILDYELGATGNADRTDVTGNLTLDGVLNVTDLAGFGSGQYTLITYTGTLTNNGLDLGPMPDNGLNYTVKTNVAGSVILSAAAPGTIILVR
jgi:autotransporter-associated beta strand protein